MNFLVKLDNGDTSPLSAGQLFVCFCLVLSAALSAIIAFTFAGSFLKQETVSYKKLTETRAAEAGEKRRELPFKFSLRKKREGTGGKIQKHWVRFFLNS